MPGGFTAQGWIVECLIDAGREATPLVLAITEESQLYLLRVPPPLRAPPPSDASVAFSGTIVEGGTEYSPPVVLCDRIGAGRAGAEARIPDILVSAWRLSPEERIDLVRRLGQTPLLYFGNRCHDLLRAATRAVAWDPATRSLLASMPHGVDALAASAGFANTFGQGVGDGAHQAAASLGRIMPPPRKRPAASPSVEGAISPEEASVIEAFASAGAAQDDDTASAAASGRRAGGPGGGGSPGGGGGSGRGRPVSIGRAGQLSGPEDIARILADIRSDEDDLAADGDGVGGAYDHDVGADGDAPGGVGPLWGDNTEPDDGFPPGPGGVGSGDIPGIDAGTLDAFTTGLKTGGEDGKTRETTDKQRKGAHRQRGARTSARPGGPAPLSSAPTHRRRKSAGPSPR